MNTLKTASFWTPPPGRNNYLDSYILKIVHDVLNTSTIRLHDDLSSNQRRALNDLKGNNNIVIKSADKGNGIVVMDKDNYMKETSTQRHGGRFYKRNDNDPTTTYRSKLKILISELRPNFLNVVFKLISSHPRPASFYAIPKVNKLPYLVVSTCPSSNPDNFNIEARRLIINPPGRPIASVICTLTEYLSAFFDRKIQPHLTNIPSYIKDTTDYLNKSSRFDNLPDDTIYVTLDVAAIYSSIPHIEKFGACKNI